MNPVNLRSFRRKLSYHKKAFHRFLAKVERKPPGNLHDVVEAIEREVWQEVDCVTCSNCCRKMTPTFTPADIKRIAAYTGVSTRAFRDKWLYREPGDKDWTNKNRPCQFLELDTNRCSIYAVRPGDCSGFPHLDKRDFTDYIHVHQQNILYCPATYKMVEKMLAKLVVPKSIRE
ncbi:YkgJ family cysteine cluster protein [Segetibacter sp. 3557_3]|uniref:YkgJ family cysteine cluster protein n=1 Tax=Segetibacter sp. 3557_3 TaxID=2547429 RepID=UPI001058FAC0|nr:YkgJ family cysteine cluster protein [Segetibacter sp. 3557_3]TDH25620.1 YkgJ family cysteine cluster protein [Segetibacter sp. 3557_3]